MLTNRSGACGFTPLRRRTLNLTRLNHGQIWSFTIYNDVCCNSHWLFLPLGIFTPIWPVLFWICPLATMSAVLFSTIARERLAPTKTVPQRSAEIRPPLKRTGTCRNLFGPVDHDELRRELSSKLREISERDQLRWNFNFSEGQPLDGDLKWEESRAEDCPQFYRETTAVSKRPFVDLPTTERVTQVAPKCGGRSIKILNQKNQINKCNRRKLSRKTAVHVQTKRLTDMRITGKQYTTNNTAIK